MSEIAYCAIYPGIGIARVGDSRDDYFIGPEHPGRPPVPDGGYKDRAGRIKRQAARFRVFGFDAEDNLVQELTTADADIVWTVHLVNRKAAAWEFHPKEQEKPRLRNSDIPDDQRGALVIDPGPRDISGHSVRGAAHRFASGTFLGERVELGELRTDDVGRLLVLGGHGVSGSPRNTPVFHFADNDGWYDDTADGPVTAEVRLRSTGQQIEVKHTSWVVVAPPDFAPSISNLVTLYDVAEQVAVDKEWLPRPTEVSFRRDIRPVLARVAGYQWVNASAQRGHRHSRGRRNDELERWGDFFEPDLLALLASPDGDGAAKARRYVFERVRVPAAGVPDEETAKTQATATFMPQLSGDEGRATPGLPTTWLTVTPVQYARLELWAEGRFRPEPTADAHDDDVGTAGTSDEAPATPGELDRAALEACIGGPFFPGIELSGRCRQGSLYVAPFRLRPDLQPGSMTEQMAVPWQADFTDCRHFWWPAQRPDDVIPDEEYEAIKRGLYPGGGQNTRPVRSTAFPRKRWDRGIGDQISTGLNEEVRDDMRHREMINEWSQLGFVTPRRAPDGSEVWLETERDRYVGLRDRDYFYIMLNLDRYPDFLPVAKELADGFIRKARDAQQSAHLDTELRIFDYDELTFDARLDSIYYDLVDVAAAYDPEQNMFRSREDVIERLRQFAPLNQTDGLWLRNVATIGPIDELEGLLTRIWIDEVGGGDPARNHANIYTDLLNSVGISTPPVRSTQYAQDESFLESAFTLPLLQLVLSQFTEHFFPEILGVTLSFEWESVELATSVRLLRTHGIDPSYYTLHLAIDNAEAGHGDLAKRAVKRYLAMFKDEQVMQEQWRRIWDGYVAFRTTGTLGEDLRKMLTSRTRPEDRVLKMIERKRQYGSLNHGQVLAATGMSNDLFDDPEQMLKALIRSGQVVPGAPEQSPFLRHFEFGGRMYKVFTEQEKQIWADWIRYCAPGSAATSAAVEASGERAAADPTASRPSPGAGRATWPRPPTTARWSRICFSPLGRKCSTSIHDRRCWGTARCTR